MQTRQTLLTGAELLALEQLIQNRRTLPDHWMQGATLEQMLKSPLLLHEYAKHNYRLGKLEAAEEAWAAAVRTSAALSMPALFTAALAGITQLRLRLGDAASAETGMRFLAEECARENEDHIPGEVYWTLAAGAHLVGKSRMKPQYYQMAISRFAEEGDYANMLRTMLDRLLDDELPVGKREYYEWRMLADRAERLADSGRELIQPVKMMLMYRNKEQDEIGAAARQQQWTALEYPYGPFIAAVMRRMDLERAKGEEIKGLIRQVGEQLHRHQRDLALRFYLLTLQCSALERAQDAAALAGVAEELGAVSRLLRREPPKWRPAERAAEHSSPRYRVQVFHALRWIRGASSFPRCAGSGRRHGSCCSICCSSLPTEPPRSRLSRRCLNIPRLRKRQISTTLP